MTHSIQVSIDRKHYSFDNPKQNGRSLKERAGIPLDHPLWLQKEPRHEHHGHEDCGCHHGHDEKDFTRIDNDETVHLEAGQHFWSHVDEKRGVTVTINRAQYEFEDVHQTGRALKERAGIPLADVLFLNRPHEDEVITDDARIKLKDGECFHSAPPANYGAPSLAAADVGFDQFESLPQPDGWTLLIVPSYPLPEGFMPRLVRLLLKLPPGFPDAAPDMFWVSPQITTASSGAPQGTSIETVLGSPWQRFSWHLSPGAWRPGTSTLRDFMRCVRARLEKRN